MCRYFFRKAMLMICLLTASMVSLTVAGQSDNAGLKIFHLSGDLYVYTTYKTYENTAFPSNSLYLVTRDGVVMFDTPWDSTGFQPLLDSIEARHHQKVILCISTHFHADRTAGVEFLQQKGVKTFSSRMTYDLCKSRHEKQPEFYFTKDTIFNIGGHRFQTFYPGEGHAPDNIVIWFDRERTLYGGCFVKSTENNDPGNIADANLTAWPESIRKVMKKFPGPRFVIPGHFSWANNQGLQHTLKLLL